MLIKKILKLNNSLEKGENKTTHGIREEIKRNLKNSIRMKERKIIMGKEDLTH
jgi:hypothetical protein